MVWSDSQSLTVSPCDMAELRTVDRLFRVLRGGHGCLRNNVEMRSYQFCESQDEDIKFYSCLGSDFRRRGL